MNKKSIAIVLSLFFIIPNIAKAEVSNPPTLAIVDTSIDTSLPILNDKVVYEVCLLDFPTCPNKTPYQEGVGSATMPIKFMLSQGFEHGTEMAVSAVKTNPNIKIVFIRIIGANSRGYRQSANEDTVVNALTWIYINKDRLNIRSEEHTSELQSH